ncbi:uncharacterized protein LOC135810469 [Sycon ciliatum]|uniref:uncharacterized protein LOC135810469 n=1 Tax=Sycon ciliatum TaxID=27933 RepID=UPI0031F6C4A8
MPRLDEKQVKPRQGELLGTLPQHIPCLLAEYSTFEPPPRVKKRLHRHGADEPSSRTKLPKLNDDKQKSSTRKAARNGSPSPSPSHQPAGISTGPQDMQDLWKPTPPDKWTLPSKAQHELFAPESSRVTHLPPLVHVEKKPKAQGAARTTPVKRSRVVPSSSFGQTGDSPGQVRSTVIRPQAAVSTEAASSTAVTASAVVDNVGDSAKTAQGQAKVRF